MKPVDEELELTRLLASEPSPLASSLSALRERGPDATELGSLASRLSLRGVAVTQPPSAPAPAPKPWKPWLVAGGGGAAIGALWLALRGTTPAPLPGNDADARARALEAQRTHSASSTPAEARGRQVGQSTPRGAAVEAESPAAPTPVAADDDDAIAPPMERSDTEALLPASEAAREAARSRVGTAAPSAAPLSAAVRTPAEPTSGASPTPGPSSTPGAPTEIELLRDARLALKQSPGAALAFAEQHARLYPRGKLSQERELIAISALVASGRRTAALSRGARFEQLFPTSPYRKQLGELLK